MTSDPSLLSAMLILQSAAQRVEHDRTLGNFERWQGLRLLYHAQLHISGVLDTRDRMAKAHPWSNPDAHTDNPARTGRTSTRTTPPDRTH